MNGVEAQVTINLGERSYPVYIAPGLTRMVGYMIKDRLPKAGSCNVVTSQNISDLHGASLMDSLNAAGIKAGLTMVPDGEDAKTWASAEALIGEMLDHGMNRNSFVVAFGGGTVGDLAGFAASIYMRGIPLIQVPTTLLAMVDSGIGGKTAVNHPRGKNLIGAFHQPSMVVSDINLLSSLPRREMLNGLGEIVKHSVIADGSLFNHLEENSSRLVDFNSDLMADIVARNVAIKAGYVEKDERDSTGIRAVLNYGHTTGHALENLSKQKIKHGEAVALGMCVASRLSVNMGLMREEDQKRQLRLLTDIGFNLDPPHIDSARIMEAMGHDKKAEAGVIRFVLPTGIGSSPVLRGVSEEDILVALEAEGYG